MAVIWFNDSNEYRYESLLESLSNELSSVIESESISSFSFPNTSQNILYLYKIVLMWNLIIID